MILAIGVVAAALVLTQAPVWAQSSGDSTPRPTNPEALKYLDEGYRLYEAGEFEKAIEAYKKGAEIDPGPRFHFNLGQCYRRLRQYDQAIFHFERVAADVRVSDKVRGYAKQFIKDMKAEMAKAASSNPPTGPAESLDDAPETQPGPDRSGLSSMPAQLDTSAASAPRWYRDSLGWSLTAAGGVALLTGAGLEVHASSLVTQADRETAQEDVLALKHRAHSNKLWGAIALGVGAGILAAGIVRLALIPESNDSRTSARLGIRVGPTWIGISGYF